MTIEIRRLTVGEGAACEAILRTLPDWFGIESSLQAYAQAIPLLETFVALHGDEIVAFLALKRHFDESSEIEVMAVAPPYHRRGLGRRLVDAAATHVREQGGRVLQVKTLSASHPDPFYAGTRAFYRRVGFVPLEEFPTLWNEAHPCLLLVLAL